MRTQSALAYVRTRRMGHDNDCTILILCQSWRLKRWWNSHSNCIGFLPIRHEKCSSLEQSWYLLRLGHSLPLQFRGGTSDEKRYRTDCRSFTFNINDAHDRLWCQLWRASQHHYANSDNHHSIRAHPFVSQLWSGQEILSTLAKRD